MFSTVFAAKMVDRRTIAVTANLPYTDSNKPGAFSVDHIIDGKPSTVASSCSCCGTVNERGWIQLDLINVYLLDHIVIKGRSDRECVTKKIALETFSLLVYKLLKCRGMR